MHGLLAVTVPFALPAAHFTCAPLASSSVQVMLGFINEWQEKLGVKIVCSQVCIRALAAAQLTLKSLRNVPATALQLVALLAKQQTTKSTAVCHTCLPARRRRNPWALPAPWLWRGTCWMTAPVPPSSCSTGKPPSGQLPHLGKLHCISSFHTHTATSRASESVAHSAAPVPCLCCSDVICEYPLKDMLDFHKARKAESTILVTKVCQGMQYSRGPEQQLVVGSNEEPGITA